LDLKVFEQKSHVKGLSPVWTPKWLVKCAFWENLFLANVTFKWPFSSVSPVMGI